MGVRSNSAVHAMARCETLPGNGCTARLAGSLATGSRAVAEGGSNDITERERIWRRFSGDEWAAFEALPPAVRHRMHEHAYDAWAVNALLLWRTERRRLGSARAERRLLRWLEECEALERAAFAEAFQCRYGTPLPHDAAKATVLRRAVPVHDKSTGTYSRRGVSQRG